MRLFQLIILGAVGCVAANLLIYMVYCIEQQIPEEVISSLVQSQQNPTPDVVRGFGGCRYRTCKQSLDAQRKFNDFVRSHPSFANLQAESRPDSSNLNILSPICAVAIILGGPSFASSKVSCLAPQLSYTRSISGETRTLPREGLRIPALVLFVAVEGASRIKES